MILNKFQTVTEQAVASYNFTDIASATGYQTYYGGLGELTGAMDFALAPTPFYSNRVLSGTGIFTAGTAVTEKMRINFDTSAFRLPRYIKGTAIFNIPHGYTSTGSSHTQFPVVEFCHVNASDTETRLLTLSGVTVSKALSGQATKTFLHCLDGNVTGKLIKVGEKLRCRVKLMHTSSASQINTTVFMGFDPQGRLTSANDVDLDAASAQIVFASGDVTALTAQIPFKIDL